jgi:hypothetical protein
MHQFFTYHLNIFLNYFKSRFLMRFKLKSLARKLCRRIENVPDMTHNDYIHTSTSSISLLFWYLYADQGYLRSMPIVLECILSNIREIVVSISCSVQWRPFLQFLKPGKPYHTDYPLKILKNTSQRQSVLLWGSKNRRDLHGNLYLRRDKYHCKDSELWWSGWERNKILVRQTISLCSLWLVICFAMFSSLLFWFMWLWDQSDGCLLHFGVNR